MRWLRQTWGWLIQTAIFFSSLQPQFSYGHWLEFCIYGALRSIIPSAVAKGLWNTGFLKFITIAWFFSARQASHVWLPECIDMFFSSWFLRVCGAPVGLQCWNSMKRWGLFLRVSLCVSGFSVCVCIARYRSFQSWQVWLGHELRKESHAILVTNFMPLLWNHIVTTSRFYMVPPKKRTNTSLKPSVW